VRGGDAGRCVAVFERCSEVAAIVPHIGGKREGKCLTVCVTQLFGEWKRLIKARHSAIGKT
jgi:hypothetical protein